MKRIAAMIVLAVAGCGVETTRPWDLVHDRIVAVRAGAAGLAPGERAAVDVLVTSEADGPAEVAPTLVAVVPSTPAALANAVALEAGGWTVVAPDAAAIAAARAELALPADAPVPLAVVVTVSIGGAPFAAVKSVTLGAAVANPAIGAVRVDGAEAGETVTIAPGERAFAIDADAAEDRVDWLTSIGELDDEEDATAHLTVEAPGTGAVVVVRRTRAGGVAWRVLDVVVE